MRLLLFVALLGFAAPHAHAHTGIKTWWKHFCERWLVTDDPWQWDEHPTEAIVKMYEKDGVRLIWRPDDLEVAYHQRALYRQLKFRYSLVPENEKEMIREALDKYPLKVYEE